MQISRTGKSSTIMDDFDFTRLSDDPELAFAQLEKHFREALHEKSEQSDNGHFQEGLYIEYMNLTLGATKSLGLDFLKDYDLPSRRSNNIYDTFYDFSTVVTHIVLQINISHARHHKKYSVALSPADKEKVRHYIEQIKSILEISSIPVVKKDDLFKKLNVFAAEVDKIRTSMETLGDVVVGLAHIGGEAASELEPVRKWVDSIARLIGRYRDMEDAQRELPRPEDRLRIEPPRLQIPDQSTRGTGRRTAPNDLDDEIPF